MSFKSIQLITISFLLFGAVACGKKDSSSSSSSPRRTEVNKVCVGLECLSSVNWKILLQGRSFPDKVRVDINGTTILNECVSKQKYFIDRTSEPQQLYLENLFVPKRGSLKINVVDLGRDCSYESPFIDNQDVEFVLNKNRAAKEIVIHL
jgi:hypothetical protein